MNHDHATALTLFASTFAVVFCLGLQSQFVNNGHYKSAFFNSLAIGGSNLLILKNIPATPLQTAAYLCGGAFAIVLAMWVFAWIKSREAIKTNDLFNPERTL